jgi:O-methyltransferase involved in polyketide biosynthesis
MATAIVLLSVMQCTMSAPKPQLKGVDQLRGGRASTMSAATSFRERFTRPWSSRLTTTDIDVLVSASRLTGVRTPWNAPTGVWKAAWKIQSAALPLLHATDRLDLGSSLADTNVNLHCLWWKAIAGDREAYNMLPPLSRTLVAPGVRRLYPLLHHQNVAIRTAYLDGALQRELERARAEDVQIVVLVLGGGFDTRALRFGGVRGVEFVECDLPAVVDAKRKLLATRLARRAKRAGRTLAVPTLESLDMNSADSRASFVQGTLRDALARARRAADATSRRARGPLAFASADEAPRLRTAQPRGGVRVLIVAEATLLYLSAGSAAATLAACVGECRREARAAAAVGAPSALDGTTDVVARLLLADRLPGTVDRFGGESAEALAKERAAAESWLGCAARLCVDEWYNKPGKARQMGIASASL